MAARHEVDRDRDDRGNRGEHRERAATHPAVERAGDVVGEIASWLHHHGEAVLFGEAAIDVAVKPVEQRVRQIGELRAGAMITS